MDIVRRTVRSIVADRLAYGIVALGALIQLFLITRPVDYIITNLLPDDAFYYFEIARNIVTGAGSTFDGVNATNGYHPLWMLVILPVYRFLSAGGTHDVVPVYAALGISLVLNVATAFVLHALLKRVTDSKIAHAFGLLVWSLNPFVLFETLNGLETSLSLLLLTCFMLLAFRIEDRGRRMDYVLLSITAGLMILARMDLAFYLAAFLAWLVYAQGLKKGVSQSLLVGIGTTVIVLPWFLWNASEFGMILTSASAGNSLVHHALVAQDNGPGLFVQIKGSLYLLVYHAKQALLRTGAPWLVFSLLGAAGMLLVSRPALTASLRRHVPLMVFLFGGFAALFFVNAGLRFTGRAWYFISLELFVALGAAWVVGTGLSGKMRAYIATVLAIIVIATFALGWKDTLKDQFVNQRGMYEMAIWMNEHLPDTARIGVFNAGVQAYFAKATVVNLDGLVNNAAFEAMRDRALWQYILDERLDYISDFEFYLTYRYAGFFGVPNVLDLLQPVEDKMIGENTRGIESITLYRVLQGTSKEGV